MFTEGEMFFFKYPDDEIFMDSDCYLKILKMWATEVLWYDRSPYAHPPIDLMKARTIPLPSFFVNVGTFDLAFCTDTEAYDKVCIVDETGLQFWFKCFDGDYTYEGCDKGWFYHLEDNEQHKDDLLVQRMKADIDYKRAMFLTLLDIWYGVQILHLHPQLKLLFSQPTKQKQYAREGTGKDRKRVVKYIRKHYITAEGIDEALYGKGHRDFERKTMAWYVIGHWRQYKNGTRKFINGYWKGPLRAMKRNLDGGRIRELAV